MNLRGVVGSQFSVRNPTSHFFRPLFSSTIYSLCSHYRPTSVSSHYGHVTFRVGIPVSTFFRRRCIVSVHTMGLRDYVHTRGSYLFTLSANLAPLVPPPPPPPSLFAPSRSSSFSSVLFVCCAGPAFVCSVLRRLRVMPLRGATQLREFCYATSF